MSNTAAELFNLSEKESADFKAFKDQHIPCSRTIAAFDMIPDDCFSYHFYPNSLGGLIEIECVCGAKWVSMDGSFYIREMPEPKDIKDEELIILIVKQLLSVCKRPRMFFQENTLEQFYAYMRGIWQALSFVGRGDEYFDLTCRLDQRLKSNNPKFDPHKPISKNLLEEFDDELDAIEYWKNSLIDFLKEEHPKLYEACLTDI